MRKSVFGEIEVWMNVRGEGVEPLISLSGKQELLVWR